MDADQIEERLLFELRNIRHDDVFSGASAVDLVMLIRGGAKRMAAEGRTSEGDLAIATENLHKFVVQMDVERKQLGLSKFEEMTVSAALSTLCPNHWPLC